MHLPWTPENLEEWLLNRLSGHQPKGTPSVPRSLTVGVEHEFFLCDLNGNPASEKQSQSFLKLLSCHHGWYVREQVGTGSDRLILRLSFEESDGKYSCIKYDHHPHLLEIAFSYFDNLHDLKNRVEPILAIVRSAAIELGLAISPRSHLDISPLDSRIMSPIRTFHDLRSYRAKLLSLRGVKGKDLENENYAAIIAATQTHIGGTNWWKLNNFVSQLYSYETEILLLTTPTLRSKRWGGYYSVFRGFPLVGFPDLPGWSMKTWAQALFQSPLAGKSTDSWSAHQANQLSSFPFREDSDPWLSFMKSVRDLQIIRPKIFGTLEFRSDPSQSDAGSILAVAALRLGLCSFLIAEKDHLVPNFKVMARKWWELAISNDEALPSEQSPYRALEDARKGLLLRGKQEEPLLAPLYNRLEGRKPA